PGGWFAAAVAASHAACGARRAKPARLRSAHGSILATTTAPCASRLRSFGECLQTLLLWGQLDDLARAEPSSAATADANITATPTRLVSITPNARSDAWWVTQKYAVAVTPKINAAIPPSNAISRASRYASAEGCSGEELIW